MTTIPVPIDLGQIFLAALAAAVVFVWTTLHQRIAAEDTRVETRALSEMKSLEERLARLDNCVSKLPAQIDTVCGQLRNIELQMAGQYFTKKEIQDSFDLRGDRISAIERDVAFLMSFADSKYRPRGARDDDDDAPIAARRRK